MIKMCMKGSVVQGWRASSVVKRWCCSCKRLEFSSQPLCVEWLTDLPVTSAPHMYIAPPQQTKFREKINLERKVTQYYAFKPKCILCVVFVLSLNFCVVFLFYFIFIVFFGVFFYLDLWKNSITKSLIFCIFT